MWEVKESIGEFTVEKRITGVASLVYAESGRIYKTPYHIEAKQIADELNKESK